jgi:hypothetical protein
MGSAAETLQLVVAVLLPLGLIATMVAIAAKLAGRTPRQVALGLAAIAACVLGVVAIGLLLQGSRGGPLLDLAGGSLRTGRLRAVDLLGLAGCAGLLIAALRVSKWLTRTPTPAPPSGDVGARDEDQ